MHRIRDQIVKVWLGTAFEIDTNLTNEEVEERLSQERSQSGDMLILVRRRNRNPGYVMVALKSGRSNAFQRFSYCVVTSTKQGAVLEGIVRTRNGVRWFMNTALVFFALLFVAALMAAMAKIVQGSPEEAPSLLIFSLLIAVMATAYLSMAYASMVATESNERYLAEWLRQRLT